MLPNSANSAKPDIRVCLHVQWEVASPDVLLTPEALERLPTYATRYAQTLGVVIRAVGGADDHLHLLFDMPGDRTIDSITVELQRATARFLHDVLGRKTFAWSPVYTAESVGAEDREALAEYVTHNRQRHEAGEAVAEWEASASDDADDPPTDAIPQWLRDALP